jgi:hypothetical protein
VVLRISALPSIVSNVERLSISSHIPQNPMSHKQVIVNMTPHLHRLSMETAHLPNIIGYYHPRLL